ncbi:MAG: hypothetical protein HQ522_05985 [Bacteroidetes bacterium]|nr:hypothetical protein [Bacteroidota bacterium]
MEIYKILSSIGLLLDIVGVIMLFRFGLPSKVGDAPGLVIGDILPETVKKNVYIKRMAYVSLGFLIIGFSLQLAGMFLQ